MQRPFHPPEHLALIFALCLFAGCYSHAGQSYGGDDDQWQQLAIDACQRGDSPAFEAFIDRIVVDEQILQCLDRTVHEHTVGDVEGELFAPSLGPDPC